MLALVAAAFLVRLPGIGAGLPAIYEEAYPYKRAWMMWGFDRGGGFDPNPHFFRYPSLVLYLQLAGQALTRAWLDLTGAARSVLELQALAIADPTPFVLVGRGLIALAGALAAWTTWRAARAAKLGAGAWVAGVVVAMNAALIAKSKLIEVDVPLALFVAWALERAIALRESRTIRNAALAGVAVGLATSAKYTGAAAFLAPLLACFVPRRAAADGARRRDLAPLAALGVALLAAALAFALTSPYVLLDAKSALADLAAERQHQQLGHFGDAGNAALYFVRSWFTDVAGWPLALAALAGLLLAASRAIGNWAWVAFGVPVGFVAALSSTRVEADRYLLPLVPVAAVYSGALVDALLGTPRLAALAPRSRVLLAAACAAVLAAPSVPALAKSLAGRGTDPRTEAKRWIESHVPSGSMIVSEAYGPPLVGAVDLIEYDESLRRALVAKGYGRLVYARQTLPSFQVLPRRSARFYDARLWRDADAFVVTESVRSRYAAEPDSFGPQLAFYDTIAARFPVKQEFRAPDGSLVLTLHWHGRADDRFADREPAGPDSTLLALGNATGGEAYTCFTWGANYEAFRKWAAASRAYQMCLRYPATPERYHTQSVVRLASLLLKAGRPGDAAGFLDEVIARPVDEGEAAALARMRAQIAAPR